MSCSVSRRKQLLLTALGLMLLLSLTLFGGISDLAAQELSGAKNVIVNTSGNLAPAEFSLVGSSLRMLGALLLCLGVFALGLKVTARIRGESLKPRRRRMEVRERLNISSKLSVTLISLDNREYLLASGSNSVTLVATNSITTPLFADSLDQVLDDVGANDG
jgi:flagellar biogenesis protein FliO